MRIIRAIRFATVLNFRLDKTLKEAIIENKHLIKKISYERKKDELNKIFCSKYKNIGVNLIKTLKLEEELDLHNIEKVLLTNDLIGMWSGICDIKVYPFTKIEKSIIKDINNLLNESLEDVHTLYKYGIYSLSIDCDIKGESKKALLRRYDKLPIKDRKDIMISTNEICTLLDITPSIALKDIYNDLEDVILRRIIKNDLKSIKKYLITKYL